MPQMIQIYTRGPDGRWVVPPTEKDEDDGVNHVYNPLDGYTTATTDRSFRRLHVYGGAQHGWFTSCQIPPVFGDYNSVTYLKHRGDYDDLAGEIYAPNWVTQYGLPDYATLCPVRNIPEDRPLWTLHTFRDNGETPAPGWEDFAGLRWFYNSYVRYRIASPTSYVYQQTASNSYNILSDPRFRAGYNEGPAASIMQDWIPGGALNGDMTDTREMQTMTIDVKRFLTLHPELHSPPLQLRRVILYIAPRLSVTQWNMLSDTSHVNSVTSFIETYSQQETIVDDFGDEQTLPLYVAEEPYPSGSWYGLLRSVTATPLSPHSAENMSVLGAGGAPPLTNYGDHLYGVQTYLNNRVMSTGYDHIAVRTFLTLPAPRASSGGSHLTPRCRVDLLARITAIQIHLAQPGYDVPVELWLPPT